jgi:MATE family multidrug resistance protein
VNQGRSSVWSQECGLKEVLTLALPLVVSTSSFALMYFCDRLMLTMYSTEDMAAVMQASALSWSTVSFPLGIAAYSMAFVAQYRGSNQPERIGAVFWQTAKLALYALPGFILLGVMAPTIFEAFRHEPSLIERETLYFQIMVFGLPGMVVATAMNSFFIGMERPRGVMVIDVLAAIVNVLLDYLLIFGPGLFPEWGLAGAAWATVISIWLKVAAYSVLMAWQSDRHRYQFSRGLKPDRVLFKRILRYGVPNGLQFLLEGGAFTLVILFLGKLGPLVVGATTLAFSINIVAFVPMVGIGMAVTTMVGNQIGRGKPELARRATWNGLAIALVYSAMFAAAYFFLPHWFLYFHQLEDLGHQDLKEWTEFLLRFVAAYCIFDAIQIIFASAIKGAGDTVFTVLTFVISTTLLVLVGMLGESYWVDVTAITIWWWSLLTLFLFGLAGVFGWRFLQGRWMYMSVIDRD